VGSGGGPGLVARGPRLQAGARRTLIKSGLAVRALAAECKGKKLGDVEFDLYLEVAEESLQALEPGSEILQSVFARAGMGASKAASHPFVHGGAALAKLGTVIEASRNLIAAGQTLATLIAPIRSSTDLANYLDRGETVPAWLESIKGLVQVASGGAGVGTLVLGASTTLAAVPLSAWVAVGLVAVATLDVLIYVKTGGGSPVDAFMRSVRDSRRQQFKLSTADGILMPGEEVVPGEVDPGSGGPNSNATCRLVRKLGALNEIAKQARLG
jgi:hypothetical protein